MDSEEGHVECDWNNDETEDSSKEVFEPQALCIFVSPKIPFQEAQKLTSVIVFVSPIRTHNWMIVKEPIQAIVNNPTHFTLTVAPRPRPVAASQSHQLVPNALEGPCSC